MIWWSRIENFFGTLYLSESHGLQTFGKAAIHRRVWAYWGLVPQNWIIAETTQTTLWDYYFKNWFEEILSALHLENFRKVRNNFKETTRARKNSFTTFSYLMKEIYRRILQPEPEPEKHYSCKKGAPKLLNNGLLLSTIPSGWTTKEFMLANVWM